MTGGLKPSGSSRELLRAALTLLETSGKVARRRWLGDPEREPPSSHRETTVPAMVGGRLLVPTRAAVYEVDPTDLSARLWSHEGPMSDLHSVAPRAAGGAWVTSTGIDAVLGVDEHGAVVERWDLGTRRVDGDVRGRAYRDLKPHEVHPNLAAEWGDTLWVTCFEEQRARSRDGREIAFPEGPPHDGHVREGLVWFTTVTGHVIAVDPADGRRVEHYDLNEMAGVANPLGWCRGVEVLGDLVYVGMTQLRASAHREVARRLLRGAEGVPLPSRIVVFSRANREIVREIAYGNRAGGTIHAILAIRDE